MVNPNEHFFNLISAPVPMLPNLSIETQVGLSANDPTGKRHAGMSFDVWLTVFAPDGSKAKRFQIDHLQPGQRRFYNFSNIFSELNFKEPYLVAVHRIPSEQLSRNFSEADFDMYRTVVQFKHSKGGTGSVIYETPPHMNENLSKKGRFLSFTNQVVIGQLSNTYFLFLNYSINPDFKKSATVRILIYQQDGHLIHVTECQAPPFGIGVIDFQKTLHQYLRENQNNQFSIVACSEEASFIPLILNTNDSLGGISVEHTHPPFSFLTMPISTAIGIRDSAIQHYLNTKHVSYAAISH